MSDDFSVDEKVGLMQSEIDALASHLEEQEISEVALFKVLKKLPDSEYGEGEVNPDFGCYCVLCNEKFEGRDDVAERYGKFVHIKCAKERESDSEVKEEEQ